MLGLIGSELQFLDARIREVGLIQQSPRTMPLEPVLGKFRPVAAKGLKAHDRNYADTRR